MQEKNNILKLSDYTEKQDELPENIQYDPLPCDTESPENEYRGQRYTLGKYSIMNDLKGWIVLCHVPETSPHHPFVTWYYNAEDNGYYHGNYFANEIEAREDFKARINKLTIH